jgi:hypothetical protein
VVASKPTISELVRRELAEAFSTIEVASVAGHRSAHADVKGVRRLLPRSTRHHVYYVAATDAAIIPAVWGSIKGSGPDLAHLGKLSRCPLDESCGLGWLRVRRGVP